MPAPLLSQPSPNTFSAICLHFLIEEGSSLSKLFIISFATTEALFCKLFPLHISAWFPDRCKRRTGYFQGVHLQAAWESQSPKADPRHPYSARPNRQSRDSTTCSCLVVGWCRHSKEHQTCRCNLIQWKTHVFQFREQKEGWCIQHDGRNQIRPLCLWKVFS